MKPTFQHPTLRRAILKANGCLLVAALLLIATAATPAAESLSVLLQKGIFAEETEGNLDAAIKIYEDIVKEGEANRSLVAQAQYRLGVCELKRGKKEQAEAAFRKIIGQFTDQSDVAAKARERLGELGKSASSVVVRQVWSDPKNTAESVSLDGRHLAFIDWDTGNLAVRDLAIGQTTRLTDHGSWKASQWAESCAFSRDGKQIAYGWHGTNDSYGLHVVSLDDLKSKALIGQQTNRWLSAEDWSPDGKSIAVFDSEWQGTNGHGGISLVSVADGAVRKVTRLPMQPAMPMRFSPDGTYLAYNLARNKPARAKRTNDIFVVNVQAGTKNIAVENLANEQFVGWASRGSEILFTSERRGTTDLWALDVKDGHAAGQPKLLKADLGDIEPIGMTRDGAFFYNSKATDLNDIYLASVNFETGKVLSEPKLVSTRHVGSSEKAIWTSDGRFLIFRSGHKEPAVHVLDLETGQQREFEASRKWAGQPGRWYWSPDSNYLLFALRQWEQGPGLYLMNLQTGELAPLVLDKDGTVHRQVGTPFHGNTVSYLRIRGSPRKRFLVQRELSGGPEVEYEVPVSALNQFNLWLLPNGKSIFYVRQNPDVNLQVAVWRHLETGREIEMLTSKHPFGFSRSFEGDIVGLWTGGEDEEQTYTLFTFPSLEPQKVFEAKLAKDYRLGWLPGGGRYFMLMKTVGGNGGDRSEVWTYSITTGEMTRTELSMPGMRDIAVHPDGKRVRIQTSMSRGREVWVMENFLPQTVATK